MYLNVFSMITGTNESKTLIKHILVNADVHLMVDNAILSKNGITISVSDCAKKQ